MRTWLKPAIADPFNSAQLDGSAVDPGQRRHYLFKDQATPAVLT